MSSIYKKSVSERYRNYFAQSDSFTRPYARYFMDRLTFQKAETAKPWDTGVAGVPLFWSPTNRTIVSDHTDSHTLVVGPTGSKKSRLIAMPQVRILGSAKENMIISDPKAEIFHRTASFLNDQGYQIFTLNLRAPNLGNCWNPLAIPYQFFCQGEIDRAYEFVNDIAENLIHSGEINTDPFWDNSAGSFFFGLTLLLFKYCKEHNLGAENVSIRNVIELRHRLMMQTPQQAKQRPSILWSYAKSDPIIASSLVGTVETALDTQGGIISTFDQKVRMFSIQPNLMEMLANSTIDLDSMDKKPTAIFVILPDEKTGYHALASLFIKQSYEYLIFRAQSETSNPGITIGRLKNRVNYLLDEFSSMPTIQDFPAMITAARSRNIRFTLLIQSKHQLLQRYKQETETIMTNCTNWIILTSREYSFLEEISSLCGKTNENPPMPVISADQIQRLEKEKGEALILSGRELPFISHLADIEQYDRNQFTVLQLATRKPCELKILDFFAREEQKKQQEEREKIQNFMRQQTGATELLKMDLGQSLPINHTEGENSHE